MENGKVITTVSDDIPSWEVEVWMKVSVEVSATEAVIKIDDQVVTKASPHHPLLSQGGVAIPNGHGNVVSYKNYMLIF